MDQRVVAPACVVAVSLFSGFHADDPATVAAPRRSAPPEMVVVQGGTFEMGDVFAEADPNERPVHPVTLRPFLLAKHEVTVEHFHEFVLATSYRSSAEHPEAKEDYRAIASRIGGQEGAGADRFLVHSRALGEADGAAVWNVQENRWQPYQRGICWSAPGFAQTAECPVVAVSWDDAIHFCNWLSRREGLAPAYDEASGRLLDASGAPTASTAGVVGYRLPTEAEWEYAAREGGRKVRFATGGDTARFTEINFRADAGSYPYLEKAASYRKGTVPVGSLPPNRLGLHEMSGNAWEWVSDHFAPYDGAPARDPYVISTAPVAQQTLRGGRWGGDAAEARVSARSGWVRNDRCNNSGFRVARSLRGER